MQKEFAVVLVQASVLLVGVIVAAKLSKRFKGNNASELQALKARASEVVRNQSVL